uniref:Uncharacterized protein n=1 Tax=Oryza nivara TaxID=4536 RepID=A0A0E0I0P2_ORYNI
MAEASDSVCERRHGGRARASGSAAETVVVLRVWQTATSDRRGARGATSGGGGDYGARRSCQCVWRGLRRAKAGRRGAPVQWSHMSAEVEWCRGLAGGERRVKTQLGLSRTDNDGESPVLGSFEPPTDGGGGFPSLLSLETSFRHPLAETTQTIGASTL